MSDLEHSKTDLTSLAVRIVSAYVTKNTVAKANLPDVIRSIYESLQNLGRSALKAEPPVAIEKSVTPDCLISLEDGRPYKSLKRHLKRRNLTPQQYREKWGLPGDYPMVAANYSKQRSQLAKAAGLGHTRKKVEPEKLQRPVPIRKSNTPDYLISLEDGRRYKTLRPHLASHGLTPDQYRAKWGLPRDYPMVAVNYSNQQSRQAKAVGFGRNRKGSERRLSVDDGYLRS